MPHHIAAGAIFLAAKFLKVKLPSDAEKVWWQEFDVTPRQLEGRSFKLELALDFKNMFIFPIIHLFSFLSLPILIPKAEHHKKLFVLCYFLSYQY